MLRMSRLKAINWRKATRRLKKIWNLPLWPGEQLLLVDWGREVRASTVLRSRPGRLAGLMRWGSLKLDWECF